MGLYRYKCDKQEVKAALYMCDTKEIVLHSNLKVFDDYTIDYKAEIPEEAKKAHDEFYESKRWHEHGCFDPLTGEVRNNLYIPWNRALLRQELPCEDEPGK